MGQDSGSRPPLTGLSQNDVLSLFNNPTYVNYPPGLAGNPFPGDSNSAGLLGAIDLNFFVNITANNISSSTGGFSVTNLLPVPYYTKIDPANSKDDTNALLVAKIKEYVGREIARVDTRVDEKCLWLAYSLLILCYIIFSLGCVICFYSYSRTIHSTVRSLSTIDKTALLNKSATEEQKYAMSLLVTYYCF